MIHNQFGSIYRAQCLENPRAYCIAKYREIIQTGHANMRSRINSHLTSVDAYDLGVDIFSVL